MNIKHAFILGLVLTLLGPAALAATKQATDGYIYGTVYTAGDHEYTEVCRKAAAPGVTSAPSK